MIDLQSLSPPEWCNTSPQRQADAAVCEQHYFVDHGNLFLCLHDGGQTCGRAEALYPCELPLPPSPPTLSVLSFDAVVAGSIEAFDESAFRESVAAVLDISPSQVHPTFTNSPSSTNSPTFTISPSQVYTLPNSAARPIAQEVCTDFLH